MTGDRCSASVDVLFYCSPEMRLLSWASKTDRSQRIISQPQYRGDPPTATNGPFKAAKALRGRCPPFTPFSIEGLPRMPTLDVHCMSGRLKKGNDLPSFPGAQYSYMTRGYALESISHRNNV